MMIFTFFDDIFLSGVNSDLVVLKISFNSGL